MLTGLESDGLGHDSDRDPRPERVPGQKRARDWKQMSSPELPLLLMFRLSDDEEGSVTSGVRSGCEPLLAACFSA